MEKTDKPRSIYVLEALTEYCLCGDAYISEINLFKQCKIKREELSYDVFSADLEEQIALGEICREEDRIYVERTYRYENEVAKKLAEVLSLPPLFQYKMDSITVNGISLDDEQCKAVSMGLSNRISLILGGAGSGKTTLISAMVAEINDQNSVVLCAPTGKAARNLTEKTGWPARTVHSALGMIPNEDFLGAVSWDYTDLVIVDEASMMTLEMLAGILNSIMPTCRLVLLGDDSQLLSVGSGNVIHDLISIGCPCFWLKNNHRQSDKLSGLAKNVINFPMSHNASDLVFDDSFSLVVSSGNIAIDAVVKEAVKRYKAGESVQVLSPYRNTVKEMNRLIRNQINPYYLNQRNFCNRTESFRDGDRVMITYNDRDRNVVNGDVGVLRILEQDDEGMTFAVIMPDGRMAIWDRLVSEEGKNKITLAYALTVHKSQGSEYDTILMPLTMEMKKMLYRNLFYTAVSRARKKVVIFGSPQAINICMLRTLPERKSMLTEKTSLNEAMCA